MPGGPSFTKEVIEADRYSDKIHKNQPTHPSTLTGLAFSITILREKLDREAASRNIQTFQDILFESKRLDQEIKAWRASMPSDWETFEYPKDGSAWLGRTASYPNLIISRKLNDYRMHRIAVQAITVRCVNLINQISLNTQQQTSLIKLNAQTMIRTCVDEICSSVPYHTSPILDRPTPVACAQTRNPFNRAKPSPCSAPHASPFWSQLQLGSNAGRALILQPLVVAYTVPGVSAVQKAWILGQAMTIARGMGMDEETVRIRLNSLPANH